MMLGILLLAGTCFAQEVKRPTKDSDAGSSGCAGTRQASPSMALSHDAAGQTTSATFSADGTATQTIFKGRTFNTWTAAGFAYGTLTLNIKSSGGGAGKGGDGGGQACLYYSLAGVLTKVHCDSDNSYAGWNATDVITLAAGADLTTLSVIACVQGGRAPHYDPTDTGFDDMTISDIWTVGSAANPPAAGTGSTAGQAHRSLTSVN